MTECANCEKTIHEPGYYQIEEVDGPCCRGCRSNIRGYNKTREIGVDWAESHPEVLAHQLADDRANNR